MDEAVGALERVHGSANHTAVVEMVMILQISYLNTRQTASTRELQQLHYNMQYFALSYLLIYLSCCYLTDFTLMWSDL